MWDVRLVEKNIPKAQVRSRGRGEANEEVASSLGAEFSRGWDELYRIVFAGAYARRAEFGDALTDEDLEVLWVSQSEVGHHLDSGLRTCQK